MKIFKIKNAGCNECPYYQSPPLDFPKEQQYHRCKLNYHESLKVGKINDECPIRNIEDVLENFMKYIKKNNYDFNEIMDFQLANRVIEKFIEEGYL